MTPTDTTLTQCQDKIGYTFNNKELLRQSLIHASASGERLESNERLEFLGDAILSTVICHELFERFPHYLEGELTKVKSMLVSRRTCGRIANQLGLGRFLCVGKGMSVQQKLPNSCSAAALEAVIGAIYLDGGSQPAREFILQQFNSLLERADARLPQENYKSMLQQYAQRALDCTPIYEVLDEKGPDHSKCFEVGVVIGKQRFGSAWGPNKKEAEQIAAFITLKDLAVIPADAKPPSVSL